jgi:3-phenylpropionate/trans-cinnamate dioxygenase ferredoxin reductase subunit
MQGTAAHMTRTTWILGYLGILVAPRALVWAVTDDSLHGGVLEMSAINTGLVAFSLLVAAFVLMGRVRSLLSCFGIETILRIHRVVAVAGVALVVAHIILVLVSDPRGLSIFDLPHTTWAARAAVVSTLALAAVVGLALRRKRRQPRYEGWRLLHIAMAGTVFVGAWLHVWWLHHLAGYVVLGAWFALMGALVLLVALRRWLWLPLRARRRSYVVEGVTEVSGDAVTLDLRAHGHPGVPFRAGQFAWLKIGSSCFVFEEHPFTIASTATEPHRKQFTIKALGDFSELLRALRPGRRVYLDGPYGQMTIEGLDSSWGFVFIAGGIGVTPMLSMLRTLADRGDHRNHLLLLSARTEHDIVMRQEIERLSERLSLQVVYALQQPPEGWPGESGRIDGAFLDRWLPPHGRGRFDYFLCGPPTMVVAVGEQLRERGVPVRRIHSERFEVV